MKCIILHSSTMKACRVLKARLTPLGYRIICRNNPRTAVAEAALKEGCIVVSSGKPPIVSLPRGIKWIYMHPDIIARKSARDLATLIIKKVYEILSANKNTYYLLPGKMIETAR